jgi:hypothetical protein
MKIGIDLDGVLFDIQAVEKKICFRNGVDWTPAPDWNYSNYSEGFRKQIFSGFANPELMVDNITFLHPIEDIKRVMEKFINEGHELYIVSARAGSVAEQTTDFIKGHFSDYIKGIFCGDMKSKIPKLKEFGIEVMIDDSPKVIEECLENDITPIMISSDSQLYNHYLRDEVNWFSDFVKVTYN